MREKLASLPNSLEPDAVLPASGRHAESGGVAPKPSAQCSSGSATPRRCWNCFFAVSAAQRAAFSVARTCTPGSAAAQRRLRLWALR
jgi:hypothetical protein